MLWLHRPPPTEEVTALLMDALRSVREAEWWDLAVKVRELAAAYQAAHPAHYAAHLAANGDADEAWLQLAWRAAKYV